MLAKAAAATAVVDVLNERRQLSLQQLRLASSFTAAAAAAVVAAVVVVRNVRFSSEAVRVRSASKQLRPTEASARVCRNPNKGLRASLTQFRGTQIACVFLTE